MNTTSIAYVQSPPAPLTVYCINGRYIAQRRGSLTWWELQPAYYLIDFYLMKDVHRRKAFLDDAFVC